MTQERCLDLDRSDAVTGDLDDLVGPTAEPKVPVLIDLGRVARVVDTLDLSPVVAGVAFRITPDRRGETGEGSLDDHDALLAGGRRRAVLVDDLYVPPREWDAGRTGLDRDHGDAIGVGEDGAAGFRLPHVVDHGDPVFEDGPLEPLPGRRVEGLSGT